MRKHNRKNVRGGNKRYKWIFYLLLAALVVTFIFIYQFTKKNWDSKNKLSLAIKNQDGGVSLVTFDPISNEIITINIAGNTEVNVSENLGVWKLSSVWELGESQGYSPKLLTKTITRSLKFPVYLYADSEAIGYSQANVIGIIKAASFPYKTNLHFIDKISLGIFALKIKNPNRVSIDLTQTSYLKFKKLADGNEGYVVTKFFPTELLPVFANFNFSKKTFNVLIIDASGQHIAQDIAQVIEILGAKVASVDNVAQADFGCEVKGDDRRAQEIISLLFACNKSPELPDNFDLQIKIGKEFAKSY